MLGTSLFDRIFKHKFNIKQWFSSKLTFRTWLIMVISFLVFGTAFWQFGNIKGIFFQASGADPVAYWKLDEGQGTTVYTSTGTENGTLGAGASGPSWVKEDHCISGKCLLFDGTNDFVNMGDALSASDSTLGSMSFWFKSTKTDAVQPQIMLYVHNALDTVEDGFGGGRELHVNLTTTKQVQFYIESWLGGTDLNIISPLTYDDTSWHHVTAVWDKNGTGLGYLYVDGNEVGTGSMATMTSYTLTGSVFVARPLVTDYRMFGGYIDEVKVYDYALSSDQVKTQFASRGSVNGVSAQLGDDDMNRKLSNGLVGYWKMDETTTSTGPSWTALDSSGNSNTAIGTSDAGPGVGKFANGGSFDINDDYLSVPDNESLSITESITIAGWVYRNSSSGANAILGKYVNPDRSYLLSMNGGPVNFRFSSNGTTQISVAGNATVPVDSWHHIAATYNGNTVKLYIDGQEDKSESVSGNIFDSTIPVTIGNAATNGWPMNGKLDEVRLYNRALDPSEIQDLYNFAPGPVGYWKFDDGTGQTAVDVSGNGYNGSFGAGNSAPIWSQGKLGQSLLFDGSNDYVSVGTPPLATVSTNGALTLMAWIKPNSLPIVNNLYNSIIQKGSDGSTEAYLLRLEGTGTVTRLYVGSFDGSTHASRWVLENFNVGEWHHVVGLYTGTEWQLYVDGVLKKTDITDGPENNSKGIFIGASDTNGVINRYFDGFIDDAKIYNYARTQKQIVQDMNASHPAPGSPVGSALLHYRLDEGYGATAYNVGNAGSTLNGIFGTGNSAPLWTNDGKFGKALSFDGSSDYVGIASFTAPESVTISLWLYESGSSNQNAGILYSSLPSDATADWGVRYNGTNTVKFFDTHAGTTNAITIGTVTPGQWTHFAISISGTTATPYVNGVKGSETTLTQSHISRALSNFRIGHLGDYSPVAYFLNGRVDEVKIYSFALTTDQIKAEFNQGKALVLGAGSTGLGGTTPNNSASREYCVPGDAATCSSPVGEWKFDEGVGETANDTSGNGIIGNFPTGNSAPIWIKGKNGSGLSFNNSYVDLGLSTVGSRLNGNSVVTVSTWFKSLSFPANGARDRFLSISLDAGSTSGVFFGIFDDSGAIEVGGRSQASDSFQSGTVPFNTLAEWHFATGVIDYGSDTIKIYLDGQLKTNKSVTFGASIFTLGTPTFNDSLGLMPGHGDEFMGYLDNVRIYSYERTPAQIAWEYNQGKPVAWYRLDECTGSTAYNAVKNGNGQASGNNGTITIGASGSQTSTGTCSSGTSTQAWNNGTTGKFNSSLNFDGVDDYISIPDDDKIDFNYNQDFSISVWFTTPSAGMSGSFDSPIEKWAGGVGGYPYSIRWDANEQIRASRYDLTNNPTVISKRSYADDKWHHIVFTKNGSILSLYIDGKLDGTSTDTTTTTTTNSGVLEIARQNTNYYAGQIDEIKIYNYPLTATQVKTDMAQAAVRFQ